MKLNFILPYEEYTENVVSSLQGVVENTDSFHGWSFWITCLTILSGVATIVTTYSLVLEINRRRTSKKCQAKIIKDLIRHFFVNNAISEVVNHLITQPGNSQIIFREGIFRRFCVLDSDIELGKLSFSEKNYDELHELQLLLRNYNITCLIAEKHFTSPDYSEKERLTDLNDIWERSTKLTERFLNFAKISNLAVTREIVSDYIRHHYTNIEVSTLNENEYIIECGKRAKGSMRAYYDSHPYNLTKMFNDVINRKYAYVTASMS